MILFLLSFVLCTTSYPIERSFCKVNLDGYQYSFLGMGNRRIDTYEPDDENYTYIISYCQDLTQDDLPIKTNIDLTDAYAVRCDDTECEVLIHENAWDWQFYDTSHKNQGIVYYAAGEPVQVTDITYFTFDVEFIVLCDASVDDPNGPAMKIYDTSIQNEHKLQIYFPSAWGCGQEVNVPTPTPNPFEPICDYTDRYDPLKTYGIDLHLENMNGGPYGIRSTNVTVQSSSGESSAVLFYQPCERMECPPNYKCLTSNYSSAWICDYVNHTCESFGLVKDQETFITPQTYIIDGVKIEIEDQVGDESRGFELNLKCDRFFPKNHIDFASTITKRGNVYEIDAVSQNACIIPLPDPTPTPKKCFFNNTNQAQGSTITIDLTDYDKGDMVGWSTTVQVTGSSRYEATLYYEPCDNVFCPTDAYCEGDEDATIYVCRKGYDDKLDCVGYGLLNKSIGIYFQSNWDITEGLKVDYYGDFDRTASVNWRCDSTLDDNQITLPSSVLIQDTELSFEVYSKGACGTNNPSPRPPWHPIKPTPPPNPTPTPQPSVNPTDIYVINSTHYVVTPLASYQQDVFKGDVTIVHSGDQSQLYAEFHPWKQIECPSGYTCPENHPDSNFWLCWLEDDGTKYCHSIGDVRIKNEMKLIHEEHPDAGVELNFGGVWGYETFFDIECNWNEDNYSIPFDHATKLAYHHTLNGTVFRTYLDSGAVCPRQFDTISTPFPTPRITPRPDYTPASHFRYEKDDQYIEIDLDDLQEHTELITVGLFPHYQRNLYRYYPKTPGLPPSGYTVLDTDKTTANVWRCFNTTTDNYCHTCGDINIDLEYVLVNDNSLRDGLSLNYEGGYGGYEAHIQLICNESIPGNEVDFDDVGFYTAQMKAPIIFAHTSMICPKPLSPTPSPSSSTTPSPSPPSPSPSPSPEGRESVTGGAIFLFLVIAIFVLYLSLGVCIYYIKDGILEFPNADFWEQFYECVLTAIAFIFSCGKKRDFSYGDADLYEKAIA